MIKIGCLLFGLCVILCFVPGHSPMVAESKSYSFIEQCDFADKASSSVPGTNGLVVWVEIVTSRRKRRPYRNPLRKLRKQLRQLRRKKRRLLKKRRSKGSPSTGKPLAEPKPDSIAEPIQDLENIPARNKLGRPATIETNHVFCPTEGCRGFHVIGPHPDHWIVGTGTYTI